MIFRLRFKVVLLLMLFGAFSAGLGFFGGLAVSKVVQKRKDDPQFWKQAAMKQLERLKPDAEQRVKFEARTDAAVQELKDIRKATISEVWAVIERTSNDLENDLTPEQKQLYQEIKPKPPQGVK